MRAIKSRTRLIAATGAAVLASIGLAGIAYADDTPSFGNIDFSRTGSLTVHKFVATEGDQGDGTSTSIDGSPLNGVTFQLTKCAGVDMTDPDNWAGLDSLVPADCLGPVTVSSLTTGTAGQADGQVAWTGQAVGLYLVTETAVPTGVTYLADPFFITLPLPNNGGWLYDVQAYPKNELTGDGSKVAVETNGGLLPNSTTVDWRVVTAPLGSDRVPANSTSVSFVDNVGANQTLAAGPVGVTVIQPGKADITGTATVTGSAPNYTFTYSWGTVGQYLAGTVFQFDYTTTVTGAPASGVVENNTEWGKDATNWGEITVNKTDGNQHVLSNAMFAVYSGTCPATKSGLGTPLVGPTGTDGSGDWASGPLFVSLGLTNTATHDYCLVETAPPSGFVVPAWTEGAGYWNIALAKGTAENATLKDAVNTQQQGPALPMTGASGTVLLSIGGLALLSSAVGLVIVARRRS